MPASLAYLTLWRMEWRPQKWSDVQMGTSDLLYMALGHTLPTIQSKSGFLASSKGGAQSKSSSTAFIQILRNL